MARRRYFSKGQAKGYLRQLGERVKPSQKKGERETESAFIELARKRFKQADEADTQQRTRELEDLQFYDGRQWPQDQLNAREGQPGNANTGLPPVPARPSYTINKVREPIRQVLNQERQAELGIEIVATDDFGTGVSPVTEAEITLREGLVRRIQRDSQAVDARSWAFQRAVIAGRGYYRVLWAFVPGKSMDREVKVERLWNQASVSLDPAHQQQDGSDAEWGFIGTDVPWAEYCDTYGEVDGQPNALATANTNEWRALGDELPEWFIQDGETRSVRVVEYWYLERVERTLVECTDGSVEYEDAIPAGKVAALDEDGQPITRTMTEKRVKWAKIDGVQVLDETDWEGHYIPIIKVVGEEIQPYDSQRRAEGMVRPTRDSQRGFNVMVSKWVEQVGLAPVPPWMGAAGFDEGFENEYALSTTRTLPALHYNPKDLEGNPIPPPNRTSIRMEIEAIAGSIQLFDQAIASTTARQDITNLDPQIKSDRQLKRVLTQTDMGTSHFLDNLKRSIRYEGIVVNDLLAAIYNKPGRVVRTLNAKGEMESVLVGVPFVVHPQTKQPTPLQPGQQAPQGMDVQHMQLSSDVNFDVTVKVTKSYDTRREEQESVLAALVQADPQQMGIVGDLLFKYNDGPGHQELEERYKAVLIPPVQAAISGQKGPNPEVLQLQQQVQQLTAQLQSKLTEVQVKGQMDIAEAEAKGKIDLMKLQAEQEAELVRTIIAEESKIEVAKINSATQLTIADAKVQVDTQIAAAKVAAEQLRTIVEAAEEQRLAHGERAHEAGHTAMQHEHAKELADQAHQHALEQGQQAAALAPTPEPGMAE